MALRLRIFAGAAAFATIAFLALKQASASYFDYAAWADLPEDARAMYVSGAFDSFVLYSGPTASLPRYYTNCLYDLKLNGDQLADNLFAYVEAKPALRNGSVQVALQQYLSETCGSPPARTATETTFQNDPPLKNLMEIPRRPSKGEASRKGK